MVEHGFILLLHVAVIVCSGSIFTITFSPSSAAVQEKLEVLHSPSALDVRIEEGD